MRILWILLFTLGPPIAARAGIVAAHDLPAGTIISADDLISDDEIMSGITEPERAIGQQARIAIYEGRPIVASALRDPVLVSRNQIIQVSFISGSLKIVTAGRALAEGGAGDLVRVMNLSSRKTISAIVHEDGTLTAVSGLEAGQ